MEKKLKLLNEIKNTLEPLRDALDDDGLEIYADDLYDVIEKLELLTKYEQEKPQT